MKRYDWSVIRAMYEMGETAYGISKAPHMPTKQAIMKRAKKEDWHKPDRETYRLPIVAKALNIESHKLTDDLLQTVLGLIESGATIELACTAAGISPRTWATWQTQDPALKDLVRRARAGKVVQYLNTVDQAQHKDWKAATWLMQNSPDTRDQFGAKGSDNKLEVVINIDREQPVTINAD
jgi:hypothetical protein